MVRLSCPLQRGSPTSTWGFSSTSLMNTYVTRHKNIWSAPLNGRNKVHATNVWAVSLFRYFFSTLKWTKTRLVKLDRLTRAILRKYRGHYRGASLERLYLHPTKGGRGLQSLIQVWEREVVSAMAYVVSTETPYRDAIYQHMAWTTESRQRYSRLGEARRVLEGLAIPLKLEQGRILYQEKPIPCSSVGTLIRKCQQEKLVATLEAKKIHGVFHKTKETRNTKLTYKWLRTGRQRAETEALIMAAQDGVVMTRAYMARVLKMPVSVLCRRCHSMPETIGHILAKCETYFWSLYMERHNRVLAVVHHHLCTTLGFKAPKPWEPVPDALENDQAKILWDASIPTNRNLENRRPDMLVQLKKRKTIFLFEMACAYDALVEERQSEKTGKYDELAADLAIQQRGYSVKVVALVIGDMGSIGNLADQLSSTQLFAPRHVCSIVRAMQQRVLYESTRIIKRHLAW